jgi:hypothetical protein
MKPPMDVRKRFGMSGESAAKIIGSAVSRKMATQQNLERLVIITGWRRLAGQKF